MVELRICMPFSPVDRRVKERKNPNQSNTPPQVSYFKVEDINLIFKLK